MRFNYKNLTADVDISRLPSWKDKTDLFIEAVGANFAEVEDIVDIRAHGANYQLTDGMFSEVIQGHFDEKFPG